MPLTGEEEKRRMKGKNFEVTDYFENSRWG
jgi:hypothetical protein